jgi:hypothetical protein
MTRYTKRSTSSVFSEDSFFFRGESTSNLCDVNIDMEVLNSLVTSETQQLNQQQQSVSC